MHYMIMFYENDDAFAQRDDPQKAASYWGAWNAYVGAIHESGIFVSGNGLQPPSTGTTVRVVDGERLVQDGPVAAAKEQLAGYFVVDVPGLDEAIQWAARSPASAWGATEVRPVLARPPAGA